MEDINDMNAIEICQYLNSGNHTMPIILKHANGYDVYWSVRRNNNNYSKCKRNLTFKEAINTFKKFVLHAKSETEGKDVNS